MNKIAYLVARLREPSTLAGLSVLGVLFGLPPGFIDATLQVVAGAAAVAAVVLKERADLPALEIPEGFKNE